MPRGPSPQRHLLIYLKPACDLQGRLASFSQELTLDNLQHAQQCLLIHLLARHGSTFHGLQLILAALANLALSQPGQIGGLRQKEMETEQAQDCASERQAPQPGSQGGAACSSLDSWLSQLVAIANATCSSRGALSLVSRRHMLQVRMSPCIWPSLKLYHY